MVPFNGLLPTFLLFALWLFHGASPHQSAKELGESKASRLVPTSENNAAEVPYTYGEAWRGDESPLKYEKTNASYLTHSIRGKAADELTQDFYALLWLLCDFAYCQGPPVVVKTMPQAGTKDVTPNLDRISVTFSKEMMTDQQWAWVMESKDTFPKITGEITFSGDGRTCVAPVKLKPDKVYVIWFNSSKFTGFRDRQNQPAIPYRLEFRTAERDLK